MSAEAPIGRTPQGAVTPADLILASRSLVRGVGELPGVVRVFPRSSGLARWFGTPVTDFIVDGRSVWAWVTVGVDRHYPSAATVGLVGAYVRARLMESGFDLVQVRVRAALFG